MRAVLGLLLAALFVTGPWIGAGLLLAGLPTWKELADTALLQAVMLAAIVCPALASAGLVSTTALAVMLGLALPFPLAWAVGVLACIVATLVQLLAARSTLAPVLSALADRSGKARRIAAAFSGMSHLKTAVVFAVARLAPHVPFAATNLGLGAIRPPIGAAVAGSGVGAVARMGVFAWVGRGVTDIQNIASQDTAGPIWTFISVLSGVVLLVVVAQILVSRVGLTSAARRDAPL